MTWLAKISKHLKLTSKIFYRFREVNAVHLTLSSTHIEIPHESRIECRKKNCLRYEKKNVKTKQGKSRRRRIA